MRLSLFLDGANFFYMQRDRLRWWIDLRKLLEFARSKGDLVKIPAACCGAFRDLQ